MGRKKIRTMDAALVAIAVFLLLFVAIMVWLYCRTGGIPDTLCTCVFTVCGGECGVMGWIKTTKERCQDRGNELADREHEEKMQSGRLAEPRESGGMTDE